MSSASSVEQPETTVERVNRRPGQVIGRLKHSKAALVGAAVILAVVLVAILAPVLAPYDPNRQVLRDTLHGPSRDHLLGTDTIGRDILSRLIFGTRVSLVAGLEGVAVAFGLGVPTGLLAGFRSGWIDRTLTMINDAVLAVPTLVLALAVIAAVGPGLGRAMFAVGLVMMPRFFRLTRTTTRDLKSELFVRAGISLGCSRRRTIFVHILPNAMPVLVVEVAFIMGTSILAEASLSFLGLGVNPPTASWGSMLADAATRIDKPYLTWGPGVALTVLVLAFALLGDGIRNILGIGRMGRRT